VSSGCVIVFNLFDGNRWFSDLDPFENTRANASAQSKSLDDLVHLTQSHSHVRAVLLGENSKNIAYTSKRLELTANLGIVNEAGS
jgi:hypothetical protein